jgi:hypothetical protein
MPFCKRRGVTIPNQHERGAGPKRAENRLMPTPNLIGINISIMMIYLDHGTRSEVVD